MGLLQGLDRGHRLRAVDAVYLSLVVAGLGQGLLEAGGVVGDGRLGLLAAGPRSGSRHLRRGSATTSRARRLRR